MSAAIASIAVVIVIYPLTIESWKAHQSNRAHERDFVIASDLDQRKIVRSLLSHELNASYEIFGQCHHEAFFFDRLSATLQSFGASAETVEHEIVTFRPEGSLVNHRVTFGVTLAPQRLLELLDQLVQRRTINADPQLSGVVFVGETEALPVLGNAESCAKCYGARLVRISKAALQVSEGFAIVFMTQVYCDGSVSGQIASLQREGSEWKVIGTDQYA